MNRAPSVAASDPKQRDMMGTLVMTQVDARSVERVESGKVGENLRAAGAADGEVEALFLRSLDVGRRQGALSWELRTATGLARLGCLRPMRPFTRLSPERARPRAGQ